MDKDLIFRVLEFLNDHNYKESVLMMGQESGLFLSLNYVEEEVQKGNFDEVEKYLFSFTKLDENRNSIKIFFEIRKHKYLEALEKRDLEKACFILKHDLKVFETYDKDLFMKMTELITLEDFRTHEDLSWYGNGEFERITLSIVLKTLIKTNPILKDKLKFPESFNRRLRQDNDELQLIENTISGQVLTGLEEWFDLSLKPDAILKLNRLALSDDRVLPLNSDNLSESSSQASTSNKVNLPTSSETEGQSQDDDLPKTLACTLKEQSCITSMDFHPTQETLLLVGTDIGSISLWEVGSRRTLYRQDFKIWFLHKYSCTFKYNIRRRKVLSVNRILWSPDGTIFGIAFSYRAVQMYHCNGHRVLKYKEIDAHPCGVNDIAFTYRHQQLCLITCSYNWLIKVWNVETGLVHQTFDGGDGPVYSLLPRCKNNIQSILTSGAEGKIQEFFYDSIHGTTTYDSPGRRSTKISHSEDGSRLFLSGNSAYGGAYIVEWDEHNRTPKRSYRGFENTGLNVFHIDITRNQYLAVGDERVIKFWNINNNKMLTTVDADGDLPESPCIRFNKNGNLLAVSSLDNGIKILATIDGLRVLDNQRNPNVARSSIMGFKLEEVEAALKREAALKSGAALESEPMKISTIRDPTHCRSLKLSIPLKLPKISKLAYTRKGNGIVAAAAELLLLWKWDENDENPSGNATARFSPTVSQPHNTMRNDVYGTIPEERVTYFSISNDDTWIVATTGRSLSTFTLISDEYKRLHTRIRQPPRVTCIMFLNNQKCIIGMEDATILIFCVYDGKTESIIEGHNIGRITGLAFCEEKYKLVIADENAQICLRNWVTMVEEAHTFLECPIGNKPVCDTRLQMMTNKSNFLVVHQTQIAIYAVIQIDCVSKWLISESSAPITDATLSCDHAHAYVSFLDGKVGVFKIDDYKLDLLIMIHPSAYFPPNIRSCGYKVYPTSIAAHPSKPFQFAVGLTDGTVHVVESLSPHVKWGLTESGEQFPMPAKYNDPFAIFDK